MRSDANGDVRTDRGRPPAFPKNVTEKQRVPTILPMLGLMGILVAAAIFVLSFAAGDPVAAQGQGTAANLYVYAGVPTNGTSGTLAKVAKTGSLLADIINGVLYQNTGTKASPIWTNPIGIAAGAITTTKIADANVTTAKLAAGAVTSATLADDIAHTVQVSLSSSDILGLNATPKTLIAAPGSGKVIVVESILLKMVRTSTAYVNGGALEFRYTNASGAKVSADIAATVVTTGGAGTEYNSVAGVTASLTPVANAAVVMDNATAAFITGTGTAVVSIKYRIVTP
jgi:hypothetical protein